MVATNKKLSLLAVLFVVLLILFYFLFKNNQDSLNADLRVYTYSSFSGEYGPGKKLAELFNNKYQKKIEYVNSSSALVMLTKLLQDSKGVDVFIGLDQFTKYQAIQKSKWKKLNIKFDESFYNILKPHKYFVPYNWSPMTFIYRQGEVDKSDSWQGLADKTYKMSLPDPRTSSPGNVFLYWMVNDFENSFANVGHAIKKNIFNWAPSWSSSYGLFTKKNTNLTFSYLTSLVYHWGNEEKNYKAMSFATGHPYHVEYMGVPESCQNCELAKQFVQFLLTDEAQLIIMKKNLMMPVKKSIVKGTLFEKLPKLNLLPQLNISNYNQQRENILKQWKKIFRN